jgi:2,5-diamino-6-(ribosylamino)-4(3H)-pyrimidinone 5'-phosphate reductase
MEVRVNAATSLDGKLSTRTREQVALSGPADFTRVDRLRADVDAVLVGVGTVLADDPSLTVDDPALVEDREARGVPRQPTRVVADSRARTPTDARVLDDAAPTVVLTTAAAPSDRIDAYRAAEATVLVQDTDRAPDDTGTDDEPRVSFPAALDALEERGVEHLLVEGGGEVLFSVFAADVVDEVTVFVASTILGGRDAPTLVDGAGFLDPDSGPDLELTAVDRLDDGVVLSYEIA